MSKLKVLAHDSRLDLACAACSSASDHRQRSAEGLWLYPVTLPSGGKSVLLKTLLSNDCANDCLYCPNRRDAEKRPCALHPEEVAAVFMEYARARKASGLFLPSAVTGDPDRTMERLNAAARIVRSRHGFPGYLHLKIIPGASDAAILDALSLATSVSLNIEVPNRSAFRKLSARKDYDRGILRPMKRISELTAPGGPHAGVKQTTQFVVGASDEKDAEIVRSLWGLYRRLRVKRVYFSAYQRGLGDLSLPGEKTPLRFPGDLLTREHRLYQVDFLLREYAWERDEIDYETSGNLPLDVDPKQRWADLHPEFFPVRLSSGGRRALLRVPGLGPVSVKRILQARRRGRIRSLREIGVRGKRSARVEKYVLFE
ncbi:MAG: radical SAM protein [Planctomycetota bacterium]